MSHRGIKATAEDAWRRAQYRRGRDDGIDGRPGIHADAHYQRGYRSGQARRRRLEVEPRCRWWVESRTRPWASGSHGTLAPRYEVRRNRAEGWVPVCGIHARVAGSRNSSIEVRDSQWVEPVRR